VKAYVINLREADRRRRFMEDQLRRLQLDYVLVPAVHGRALTEEQRRLVDWDAFAADRQMRLELIGCNISHLDVYRRIAAGDDRCGLVLEDDARLADAVPDLLRWVEREISDGEVVLLHYRASRLEPVRLENRGAVMNGEFRLLRCTNFVVSAAGYVVTQATCRRLLDGMVPIMRPHDYWQALVERGALDRVRCVYPRPIDVEPAFKSQLGYVGEGMAARVSTLVAKHRIFPFQQLLTWRRRRYEQEGSRFELVGPD
jgi:glycosyl transferase family 25